MIIQDYQNLTGTSQRAGRFWESCIYTQDQVWNDVQTEKISVTFFARRLKAFLSGPFAILETIVLTREAKSRVKYQLGSSQTLVSRKNGEEFRQRQNKNQGTNQH